MSEEITRHRTSNVHGSCGAIFSSSPINFNKENKPPSKQPVHASDPDLLGERAIKHRPVQSSWSQICSDERIEGKMHSNDRNARNSMIRSKSVSTLHEENSSTSLKSVSDERSKTPSKSVPKPSLCSDKTPVTHFCTPRRISAPRNNGNSATPMKRYFSDRVLSQNTPECFSAVQMETPRGKQDATALHEQTVCEGENSNLTVGVRVRPLNFKELNDPKIGMIIEVNGQNISVACESSQHTFSYDHCFVSHSNPRAPEHADQAVVFRTMVLPLVHNAFEGYNVCLLAYGQTGSGKSHSMMGTDCSQTGPNELSLEAGIIPRFCHEIFSSSSINRDTTTNVEISYFEIYNEKIHDLLASNSSSGTKRAPLKVREHPVFGPYVVDLSQHSVKSYEDLQAWLQVGNSQRVTAATGMNEKSSRSHSIFSIVLTQTRKDGPGERKALEPSRRSRINLVDLAGSERLSQTCASGDRLREGVSINKSLLILGKVIASLAESTTNRKRGFVPYRESVLTWLLKESLGGNSRTAMLATVSPGSIHLEETLATLRYACQARAIVNRVRINEDPHDKLIRELKAEVLRLRGYERQLGAAPRRLLIDAEASTSDKSEEIDRKQQEIDKLRDQLKRTEEQLADTQKSSLEKLRDAEEKKNSELKFLRCCGIAVEIDYRENRTQPCLVNLAADPILSGALLYLIPPGTVRIGRRTERATGKPREQLDIVLDGPLVRQLHCTIENKDGKLVLTPEIDADTFVNGQIVTGRILLKHGDRLVIGGNHYFKVCNPRDDQANKQIVTGEPVDFEFAHQEILTIQEEKLRAELEEAKQKAIKELENAKREIEMQLGSQKSSYEQEIKVLGSTLETQKLAIENINRQKRELEIEKEELAHEVEKNNRMRQIIPELIKVSPVKPYQSNFLQQVEAILFETTADAETALRMKLSDDAIKAGGVSLHEMQLLVREATERCRDVGVNYEFYQQQMIIDKSLQPVIRVRDRERGMETIWQPLHFLDWIHRLRDHDIEDSMKELRNTVDDWESYEDSDMAQDSLNSSRISVNMTPVKKQLNESLHHLSMDSSVLERTGVNNETVESIKEMRRDGIAKCLEEMERAAKTLSRLCHEYETRETSGRVTKSIDKVQTIIDSLKTTLDRNAGSDSNDESETSNNSGFNNTVIQNSETSEISEVERSRRYFITPKSSPSSPKKRGECPFLEKAQTPKTVRFNVK